MNGLIDGHTNGALVRVIDPVNDNETEADAENRMNEFLRENLPAIYEYIFLRGSKVSQASAL
jgi:hypothetical protein